VPARLASAPNVNHLWAGLLVEELVRQGTTFFVVCPGSRSTPLAVAVAENPGAEALVHWDERAAAFVALGWGRATGRPAAVVTTSGTAVANLLPAAVEADADGVPLLLLTADRPPELRETGANQTVRQPPVFQDVARWALDWPVPTASVPARWVLSTAAHAAHRAASPPGPVHLNLPFREPLAATPDGTDAAAYLADVERWAEGDEPFTSAGGFDRWHEHVDVDEVEPEVVTRVATACGLVVAGDLRGDERAERAAIRLAEALGWPLLADLRSGLRLASHEGAVPYADLALAGGLPAAFSPTAVVHLGGRLVSKRLSRFLSAVRPATYVRVDGAPGRIDPDSLATHRLLTALADGAAALEGAGGAADPDWRRRWRRLSDAVRDALAAELDGGGGPPSEPAVARTVARAVPAGGALVAAASMPVRDLDAYADRSGRALRIVANRGASGIDGTVATAAGFARGARQPAVALVGDLALLHDQTSLALFRDGPAVTVVVVNNDGGGIFHRLPVAQGEGALAPDAFERFFGTPHGLTFEHAARQVGLAYHAPGTMPEFEAALDGAVRSGASALIEVRTDREEQAALRRRIEAAAAEAVDAALAGPDAG
jgi:2-succinyl-5-enolpyruvyl-6-hydroxy-3-cyclohexene-1-carboxylate synthase